MTITDDIVKSLRNATPLYAVAGTADLAAEKLREVPALIERLREQAPERIERIRATDPKAVQGRMAAGAKDAQARLSETYRDIDLKAFREMPDFKKLGESVQDLAMHGMGRATGYAVKARETYDGLAERGKDAVATWRGEDGGDGKGAKRPKHVLLTGGAKAKGGRAQEAKGQGAKGEGGKAAGASGPAAAKPAAAKPAAARPAAKPSAPKPGAEPAAGRPTPKDVKDATAGKDAKAKPAPAARKSPPRRTSTARKTGKPTE